jgi:choline dehydrogenase-like flavoprotein
MHDLNNVYIADSSVFVTSGGHNPGLTVMALALRTAQHLAGRRDGVKYSAHENAAGQ